MRHSNRHFKLPAYKKGDKVITPDGPGVIAIVQGVGGEHFYAVYGNAAFYAERELARNGAKKK